jgi:hypothetical protein
MKPGAVQLTATDSPFRASYTYSTPLLLPPATRTLSSRYRVVQLTLAGALRDWRCKRDLEKWANRNAYPHTVQ